MGIGAVLIGGTIRWHRAIAVMALAAAPLFSGTAPQTLTAYKGTTPAIDGTFSPGEWADAAFAAGLAGWKEECTVPNEPSDLSLICYVKHDDTCLYFAFDVTDNVIYGIDTPRWVGAGSDSATVHSLSATGWPWYGDGVELMVDAQNASSGSGPVGNGTSWKMVCSTHKSRLGGFTTGGLLEGAPSTAFTTYQNWITAGAMKTAVRIKPQNEGSGYVIEWKIRGNPCLQIAQGTFWSASAGQKSMGLNIEIEDLDVLAEGSGCWMNFRHIGNWVSGNKEIMSAWGTLVISPANNPAASAQSSAQPLAPSDRLTISGSTIRINRGVAYRVTVQNAQGKTVCRWAGKGAARCQLPDSLPSGTYEVRALLDDQETSRTIMIGH
jgi:SSS family solute:Na+ symporter